MISEPPCRLAILYDPEESLSPSTPQAIENFLQAAARLNIDCEIINSEQIHKLNNFDALFIRETTDPNNHTMHISLLAESIGLFVMDSSKDIMKCCNKILCGHLFKNNGINIPKTFVYSKKNILDVEENLSYPIVLKLSNSCFSKGVFKAIDRNQLMKLSNRMFEEAQLIICQEYIYTNFDWRIGVINGEPLFACKYFMSKKHWKIYKHNRNGKIIDGSSETLSLDNVPTTVINTAIKAANSIGKGLYGVDLKQIGDEVYVIEVNDNPSITEGIEDGFLNEELYNKIMLHFKKYVYSKIGVK